VTALEETNSIRQQVEAIRNLRSSYLSKLEKPDAWPGTLLVLLRQRVKTLTEWELELLAWTGQIG
jgi:hypothetical protein